MGEAISSLQEERKSMLQVIVEMWRRVVKKSELNKMTIENVGIVFGPTVMRPKSEGSSIDNALAYKEETAERCLVVRFIIENPVLFPSSSLDEDPPLSAKNVFLPEPESGNGRGEAEEENCRAEQKKEARVFDTEMERHDSLNPQSRTSKREASSSRKSGFELTDTPFSQRDPFKSPEMSRQESVRAASEDLSAPAAVPPRLVLPVLAAPKPPLIPSSPRKGDHPEPPTGLKSPRVSEETLSAGTTQTKTISDDFSPIAFNSPMGVVGDQPVLPPIAAPISSTNVLPTLKSSGNFQETSLTASQNPPQLPPKSPRVIESVSLVSPRKRTIERSALSEFSMQQKEESAHKDLSVLKGRNAEGTLAPKSVLLQQEYLPPVPSKPKILGQNAELTLPLKRSATNPVKKRTLRKPLKPVPAIQIAQSEEAVGESGVHHSVGLNAGTAKYFALVSEVSNAEDEQKKRASARQFNSALKSDPNFKPFLVENLQAEGILDLLSSILELV